MEVFNADFTDYGETVQNKVLIILRGEFRLAEILNRGTASAR